MKEDKRDWFQAWLGVYFSPPTRSSPPLRRHGLGGIAVTVARLQQGRSGITGTAHTVEVWWVQVCRRTLPFTKQLQVTRCDASHLVRPPPENGGCDRVVKLHNLLGFNEYELDGLHVRVHVLPGL
jgi:hypothetical protein